MKSDNRYNTMRLLINTSTIVETGCTQVSVSFIEECKKIKGHEFFVLLSTNVAKNINIYDFPLNFHFQLISEHPLYSFKNRKVRKRLKEFEREIQPDCVFSVFGPSWWTPKSPHLMGYAFPYYVYPDSPYFRVISKKDRLKIRVMKMIHSYFFKRNGRYYVCETDDVSNRLSKFFSIKRDSIFTVSNTANAYFRSWKEFSIRDNNDTFKFYSLCSAKFHKNIQILNEVIPLLKEYSLNKKVLFYTTFPQEKYNEMFSDEVKPYIVNVGLQPVSECPKFVSECDALFLPTLMGCFSASYPEAMYMQKPILTSNLPFATTVCKDSALYFDPLDAKDIAEAIFRLVSDKELYLNLINSGKTQLKSFSTPVNRAKLYLDILEKISQA